MAEDITAPLEGLGHVTQEVVPPAITGGEITRLESIKTLVPRAIENLASGIGDLGSSVARLASQFQEPSQPFVTRDQQGNIQVQPQPGILFGPNASALSHAALHGTVAGAGWRIGEDLNRIQAQHLGDPQGFLTAAQGYLASQQQGFAAGGTKIANAINEEAQQRIGEIHGGMLLRQGALDIQNSRTAVDTRINSLSNDMYQLALQGGMSSPQFTQKQAELQGQYGALSSNPVYGVPKEQADALLAEKMATFRGASIVGQMDAAYQQNGATGAQKQLHDSVGALPNLSEPERQQLIARGNARLSYLQGQNADAIQANQQKLDAFDKLINAGKMQATPDLLLPVIAEAHRTGDTDTVSRAMAIMQTHPINQATQGLMPQQIDAAHFPNGVPGIHSAIIQQESGGNPNAPGGIAQIQPDTFAAYARPGESIMRPADQLAVSQRIIADYSQRYNGDPQRIAVAYFSGPGNVAPPGSPTPWKQDKTDPNGKTTSSYVADVTGRMGLQGFGRPQSVPTSIVATNNHALAPSAPMTPESHPDRYGGALTVGDQQFSFVSGGRGRGSAPPGDHVITGFRTDGVFANRGGAFTIADKYDPKVGDTRRAIEIHDSQYGATAGCFGIPHDQWPQAKEAIQAQLQKTGTAILRVGPNGNAQILPPGTPPGPVQVAARGPGAQPSSVISANGVPFTAQQLNDNPYLASELVKATAADTKNRNQMADAVMTGIERGLSNHMTPSVDNLTMAGQLSAGNPKLEERYANIEDRVRGEGVGQQAAGYAGGQALIDQARANANGADFHQQAIAAQALSARNYVAKEIDQNPAAAAARIGITHGVLPPIDTGDPQAIADGIAVRGGIARAMMDRGLAPRSAVFQPDRPAVESLLSTGSPAAKAALLDSVAGLPEPIREATMADPEAKAAVLSMAHSGQPQLMSKAYAFLDQEYRRNPMTFDSTFGAGTLKELRNWQDDLSWKTPEQIAERELKADDPATIRAQENMRSLADESLKNVTGKDIASKFVSWAQRWNPLAGDYLPLGESAGGMTVQALRDDYQRAYRESFALNANPTAADKYAMEKISGIRDGQDTGGGKWSVSPASGGRIMAWAPERSPAYPQVNGSKDYISTQAQEFVTRSMQERGVEAPILGAGMGAPATMPLRLGQRPYALVPDHQTETEMTAGQRPSYGVAVQDPNGRLMMLPSRFVADPAAARLASQSIPRDLSAMPATAWKTGQF